MSQLPYRPDNVRRVDDAEVLLSTGTWYRVTGSPATPRPADSADEATADSGEVTAPDPADADGQPDEVLCCLTHIGSNYVEMTEWHGHRKRRIHFDQFHAQCRPEPDADRIIRECATHWQQKAQRLLGKVHALTARLGVSEHHTIAMRSVVPDAGTAALTRLSEGDRIGPYRAALAKAKDTDLPRLFAEIKKANENHTAWLKAPLIPLEIAVRRSQTIIEAVSDRIFNVSLYGGLTEDVVQLRDGDPAPSDTPLSVFQERCYMDEQCLATYRTGGMSFKEIASFDRWLLEPENFTRLLPFPRTVLAVRVRRYAKDRSAITLSDCFFNLELDRQDKSTFLYLRNGDQVWRLSTDLDFGERLFPPRELNAGTPLYCSVRGGDVESDGFITIHEYEEKAAKLQRAKAADRDRRLKEQAWAAANPDKSWIDNPYHDSWPSCSRLQEAFDQYQPFNPFSVWFDDMAAVLGKTVAYHNRIALVLQGLLDRSPVFHPHPPWRLWTPDGFAQAIRLVRDGDLTLYDGPEPDLEAYIARCNETLGKGSLTIGQDDYWAEREAVRESARMDRSWRERERSHRPKRFRPYGNPGPGYIARVVKWQKRARRATFTWNRERQRKTWDRAHGELIPVSLAVPVDRLFNVSAYKPGDFRPFFADPRSRAKYLKWAPMLLAAEEYLAGNLDPQSGQTRLWERAHASHWPRSETVDPGAVADPPGADESTEPPDTETA